MTDYFGDFAKQERLSYNLSSLLIDEEKAVHALQHEIKEEFEILNQLTVQKKRFEHFKVLNSQYQDYKEHLVPLNEQQRLIAGIRHLGGNVDFPFIHMTPNFVCTAEELRLIYKEQLSAKFEVFGPKYLRFHQTQPVQKNYGWMGNCWMVRSLKADPLQGEANPSFTFIAPTNADYYEDYKKAYTSLHLKYPKLKNKVPCNDLETMESCRKNGLLHYIQYQGHFIGIIAASREAFLGHHAFYFIEILLFEASRKQKLAAKAKHAYLHLFANQDDYIWGTIDYQNVPSLKTALSNKRKAVRYEVFYPL